MKGSIVAAGEDAEAALRARELDRLLLRHEGVPVAAAPAPLARRARPGAAPAAITPRRRTRRPA